MGCGSSKAVQVANHAPVVRKVWYLISFYFPTSRHNGQKVSVSAKEEPIAKEEPVAASIPVAAKSSSSKSLNGSGSPGDSGLDDGANKGKLSR
jgi:hypothetical protein